MITDAELQGMAAQAFNMAKREMEQRGARPFNFLLASFHEGEGLHRMRKIETFLIERLGEDWLNSGRAKDLGFAVLRKATDQIPPDALIFACVVNQFEATEKMKALPIAEKLERSQAGADGCHAMVKEGLLTVHDALNCVAQTPARVCIYIQKLAGEERPDVRFFDQETFGGRMKMFGKELPEFERWNPARKMKGRAQ